jgi:hypothetical protein
MAEAPQRLLDPVEPHIGLREEYIRDEPVTVVLAEKLFQVSGVSNEKEPACGGWWEVGMSGDIRVQGRDY